MAMKVGELYETMELRDSGFTRTLSNVQSKAGSLMATLGTAGLIGTIAAVGAAFGTMGAKGTKEMKELHDAAKRFRVDTGASKKEAEDFTKTVEKLYQQNTDSYVEIANTVTEMRQRFGEASDGMEQDMLDYAKVTEQDGVGAIKSIHSMMSAWNKDLEKTPQILDKLLMIQQETGMEAEAMQKSLLDSAVSMQALNIGMDEGIAIMGQFADRGVDAEKAGRGFRQMMQRLADPSKQQVEALRKLGIQVTELEDGYDVAEGAVDKLMNRLSEGNLTAEETAAVLDILGRRSGEKIVTAMKGSRKGIDKWIKKLNESKDTVEEASQVYDEKFGERLTLLYRKHLHPFAKKLGSDFMGAFDSILSGAEDAGPAIENFLDDAYNVLSSIRTGTIDFIIKPAIEFATGIKKAIESSKPMENLLKEGVEHPILFNVGTIIAGWGAWTAAKVAAKVLGVTPWTGALALTGVAGLIVMGSLSAKFEKDPSTVVENKLQEKMGDEVELEPETKGLIDMTFELSEQLMPLSILQDIDSAIKEWKENPPSINWSETFNAPDWAEDIFQDIDSAIKEWNENPPSINWSETFNAPDWAEDIDWGKIPWMDIINPFQKEDWPDVISDWPGWDVVAKIGELGKSAFKSYINWPGWDILADWIFPEWGELADIPEVNWKTFTTFGGWWAVFESFSWPGWEELFPELASVDWQKWTTFEGWAKLMSENVWPGWETVFAIVEINWESFTTFEGWKNLLDSDNWPGWTEVFGIDKLRLEGLVIGIENWADKINWSGWEGIIKSIPWGEIIDKPEWFEKITPEVSIEDWIPNFPGWTDMLDTNVNIKNWIPNFPDFVRDGLSVIANISWKNLNPFSGGGEVGPGSSLGMQSGGMIPGYGGGDKIPALLEKGEFVWNKELVKKFPNIIEGIWSEFQAGGGVGTSTMVSNLAGQSGGEVNHIEIFPRLQELTVDNEQRIDQLARRIQRSLKQNRRGQGKK